jgi:hypothetical protein
VPARKTEEVKGHHFARCEPWSRARIFPALVRAPKGERPNKNKRQLLFFFIFTFAIIWRGRKQPKLELSEIATVTHSPPSPPHKHVLTQVPHHAVIMRESVSKTPDGRLGYVAHEGLAVTVLAAVHTRHKTQHTQRTSCIVTDISYTRHTTTQKTQILTQARCLPGVGRGWGVTILSNRIDK